MTRKNPFAPIYRILNSGSAVTTSPEMPIVINIEITNACNFTCLMCRSGTKAYKRATGFMSKDIYTQIIEEIAPYKIPLRFIGWGEPTLHKDFYEFIDMAKSRDIMCHVNTNASMLDSDGINALLDMKLDSLKYSCQGTDAKTYAEMRYGQDFNKLVDTAKLFSELRGDLPQPYLHISTTVTTETPEMIEGFKKTFEPYVDLITVGHTKLSHISPEETQLPPDAKKLLDSLKQKETISKSYKICNEVFDKIQINWDGSVSACCSDCDNYMLIGDLRESSIKDIWQNSKKLKTYRQMLKDLRHAELPLCRTCYDTMNLKAPIAQES